MSETGKTSQKSSAKEKAAPKQAPKQGRNDDVIVIKKYANRRLYNTATSSYVTLDYLSDLVKTGQDFVVYLSLIHI